MEAIKIRIEEMQLKQKDLINEIGGKGRVSEILNRKRKLTVDMIRNLEKTAQLISQPAHQRLSTENMKRKYGTTVHGGRQSLLQHRDGVPF